MIITVPENEIRNALRGALKIFFKEPGALKHFNISQQGFLNSFQAFWILLIPIGISTLSERKALMAQLNMSLESFPSASYFGVSLIWGAAQWLLVPFLLWLVADLIGIRSRYFAYVVARNWCSIIVGFAFAIPSLFHVTGLVPHEVTLLAQLILLGFALVYHYQIARVALDKEPFFCVALVSADLLIDIIIAEIQWAMVVGNLPHLQ
ncbi:MAG: hypothetical protein AAGE89_12070 [Pseudomonadota bacterium]